MGAAAPRWAAAAAATAFQEVPFSSHQPVAAVVAPSALKSLLLSVSVLQSLSDTF